MKQTVILSNLKFFAYHGVLAQENKVGHDFQVSVKINCDFSKALFSDNVKDTINYGDVFEIIKHEMETPSKLMEHLAKRIVEAIFMRFQNADSLLISIIKENPPINADCEGCGIEMECTRKEIDLLKKSIS